MPAKPAPTSAEIAFLQDLLAVDEADKTATATLATLQANQATGTTYTLAPILAAAAPVTGALTRALNDLTALIPSLPSNMTSAAQGMSSVLSDALNIYKLTTSTA